MNTLSSYSQDELLKLVSFHVREEKRFTLLVLEDLKEIERRKLYAERGFSSLHEFCVGYLKYSDGAAYRRIKAMRLMSELTEAKEAIAESTLYLSTASTLQQFFETEKRDHKKTYSKDQKLDILHQIKGKSKSQTERVLAAISPRAIVKESTRAVTAEDSELRFTVTEEFLVKYKKLKALHAGMPEGSYAKAFEWMMDKMLHDLEPKAPKKSVSKSSE